MSKIESADSSVVSSDVIAVAIVEDNSTLRRNLERALNQMPRLKCVSACVNGAEAIDQIPKSKADVVLMDIHMPVMSGIECTARLKKILPALQILMLTVYEDTETIFKALRAGASGYLLKRASQDEIFQAVCDVHRGGVPMTSAIARKVLADFQKPSVEPGNASELSAREREILDAVAEGLSNKEIGSKLGISTFTVKIHMGHIFEKLHVRCRTEAVMAYLHPDRPAIGRRAD